MFKKRDNIKEVEEGKYFSPKFDDKWSNSRYYDGFSEIAIILMHGYMNEEALEKNYRN